MGASVSRLLATTGIAVSLLACSDSQTVTAPKAAGPTATPQILASPTAVNVVTRDTPLATALSASATIGLFGGRIDLPAAGLRVIIPPFAVTRPTQITVTAVAGSEVAYEFEPHGTNFLVPLIVTQSLTGTSASDKGVLPSVLYAGYFPDLQSLNQINGTALVTELLGTSISTWSRSVTFSVTHFSGYLVATGDAESGEVSDSH